MTKSRILVVATLLCMQAFVHSASAQAAPKRIEITAKRFAFEPGKITLKKGEPVMLVFNSGDVTHGFRCPELNLDLKIKKGTPTVAQFTPDKVGSFIAHCAVFCGSGHGDMMMTINVVE